MLDEILEALKETYENVGEEETYIDCIYYILENIQDIDSKSTLENVLLNKQICPYCCEKLKEIEGTEFYEIGEQLIQEKIVTYYCPNCD